MKFLNKDTLGPLAIGGTGLYSLSNGVNGVIGDTISQITSLLGTDIIGGIDSFDILGGGIAGLIANKKFGANKTTSLMTSLLTSGIISNNPILLSAGSGALIGKTSAMALNYLFHGNASEEEKKKLENFMTIFGGMSGVGVLAAIGLGGLNPLALGAVAYGGYKLGLPAIKKGYEIGSKGLKNTIDFSTGVIKDVGNLLTFNMFKKKAQPAIA